MSPYWVTFGGNPPQHSSPYPPGCIEAESPDEAKAIGEGLTGYPALEAKILPYPAAPRLNKHVYPEHGPMPSFCFTPSLCAGVTSCPKQYSCTE